MNLSIIIIVIIRQKFNSLRPYKYRIGWRNTYTIVGRLPGDSTHVIESESDKSFIGRYILV